MRNNNPASAFAMLTLFGEDRPGIVASIARILFDTGCNIEVSSMTRLRTEFTVMMILRLPAELALATLDRQLSAVAQQMALDYLVKPMKSPANIPDHCQQEAACENTVMINLLGADKPGIVYHVTQYLAEQAINIIDLHTKVIGSPQQPVYIMSIEVENVGPLSLLSNALATLAQTMGVEISVRSYSMDPL